MPTWSNTLAEATGDQGASVRQPVGHGMEINRARLVAYGEAQTTIA